MKTMKMAAIAVSSVCVFASAEAAPLTIAEVGAPAIDCVFDTSCALQVRDATGKFTLPGNSGDGHLQSRRAPAGQGAPAAGLNAYLYRLDMSAMQPGTSRDCITLLKVDFGPVATLNYRPGTPAQLFVVTSGGLGSVGVASAELIGNVLTVTFAGEGVCPGQSSYFLGLAAKGADKSVKAAVKIAPVVPMALVDAYGPAH